MHNTEKTRSSYNFKLTEIEPSARNLVNNGKQTTPKEKAIA
jgi:hypothetical protein